MAEQEKTPKESPVDLNIDSSVVKKIHTEIKGLDSELKNLHASIKRITDSLAGKGKSIRDKKGSFLEQHGYGRDDLIDAFTSKSPLIGLGIKYLLDRKKVDATKKGLLEAQSQFSFLKKQKEKLEKMMDDASPVYTRKRRRPRRNFSEDEGFIEEVFSPRKRRTRKTADEKPEREKKQKPEREKKQKPEKEKKTSPPDPETKKPDDNIKNAEFEDIGNQKYGAQDYTTYKPEAKKGPENMAPKPLFSAEDNEKQQRREEAAEKAKEAPRVVPEIDQRDPNKPIITPSPPIVTPPPSNAPLLLGPGKFRNRTPQGRFAKGYKEGNVVPNQPGVIAGFGGINNIPENKKTEAPPPAPNEPGLMKSPMGGIEVVTNALQKDFTELKMVVTTIGSQLVKWHAEDKKDQDVQGQNEEEVKIASGGPGQNQFGPGKPGDGLKSLLDGGSKPGGGLGGGSKPGGGLGGGGFGGLKSLFGGAGGAGGAAGGAGGAAGGAIGAGGGAIDAIGAIGAGAAGAAAITAGVVAAGAVIGVTGAKLIEKYVTTGASDARKKTNGTSSEEWTDIQAEFLREQHVDVDKPWYMPYGKWAWKVSDAFGNFLQKDKTSIFSDWLKIHHPDIAKRFFKYHEDEPKPEKKKPEQKIANSPKIDGPMAEQLQAYMASPPQMAPTTNVANPLSAPQTKPAEPPSSGGTSNAPKLSIPLKGSNMTDNIWSLAAKGETGSASGNPGIVNTAGAAGDVGGYSYGTFQIATKTGTFDAFLQYAKQEDPETYARLIKAGGTKAAAEGKPAFIAEWKAIAKDDPKKFQELQSGFIKATHYDVQMDLLKKNGIDLSGRSNAVKNVVFTMATAEGPHSNNISVALKGKDLTKMSDKDIITAIYDTKTSRLDKMYGQNSAALQPGIKARWGVGGRERKDAQAMLSNEENPTAQPPGQHINAQAKPPAATIAPKAPPTTGQNLLASTSQTQDKKATQSSGGSTNMVNAPSNTQINQTSILNSQTTPRDQDNTVRDTRYRNTVRT